MTYSRMDRRDVTGHVYSDTQGNGSIECPLQFLVKVNRYIGMLVLNLNMEYIYPWICVIYWIVTLCQAEPWCSQMCRNSTYDIYGLVQDRSNSSALEMELLTLVR